MIYIDKKKLTVDGVDVYPDHESATQFWYVPGTIRLARRGERKALSYLWYTDSKTDADGTGFLNFEVNTAVPEETLARIKSEIARAWGADAGKITLSTVPYHAGNVNFSVLGPIASQAGDLGKDPAVLYQSTEQLVWNAGSSSLVGDNAAVCSVKFTKEGKLAAAMKAALQSKGQHIAALYRLEFLAMRPSVTFTVKGEFRKTVTDFKLSIGSQIPLEAFLLDLGVNAQWQKIMQNTDLKIEVVDYTGEGEAQQEGLQWARKLLLDYVLKNFFEVQLGADANAWSPLTEAPKVEEAVMRTKAVEEAATEKVAQDGAQKADGAETAEAVEKTAEAVKEIVKSAAIPIPKVNIRASYYEGKQVNSIDFMYAERKAKSTTVLPQAVVGLGDKDQPSDYITQLNRAQDPFGQPYKVVVSVPDTASQDKLGLLAVNVQACYPAGAPAGNQTTCNLTLSAGTTAGENPFLFQYDAKGSTGVEYTTDFVFDPGTGWEGDASTYTASGISDRGLIAAMPESVAEFLTINVELSSDFTWDNADQAVISLTSEKWQGEKRVVIQKGREAPHTLRIRSRAELRDEPVQYQVTLRKGNTAVYSYGPLPVTDSQVTVVDRFVNHIPVFFRAGFADETADVTLVYEDGDYVWEDQFELEAGQKRLQRTIPIVRDVKLKSELAARYEVTYESGETVQGTIRGGQTVVLKAPAQAGAQ